MKYPLALSLLLVLLCSPCRSAWAKIAIYSQAAVNIELTAFDGLTEYPLFKGEVAANGRQEIQTDYHGLTLLHFAEGQRYPVIIDEKPLTIRITNPAEPPSFTGNGENEVFYKMLSGHVPVTRQYPFALLMIEARQLLDSSHSIATVKELIAKKREFQEFIRVHYETLKHSDMIKQLISQYFMMHEYADYHREGAPATDIRVQYHKAVLDGVGSWLEVLKAYLPEYEILNYCVSLYYNRSMVALASLIIEIFRAVSYCPGDEKKTFYFPDNLRITNSTRKIELQLDKLKGKKIMAFVSDDCFVSMVETVIKVRQLANQKNNPMVIVAPLQKLSEKHLIMNRMVSNGNMLFLNDEKWREDNLGQKIKLPLFVEIVDDFELPENSAPSR
jgi:hypothetical protein